MSRRRPRVYTQIIGRDDDIAMLHPNGGNTRSLPANSANKAKLNRAKLRLYIATIAAILLASVGIGFLIFAFVHTAPLLVLLAIALKVSPVIFSFAVGVVSGVGSFLAVTFLYMKGFFKRRAAARLSAQQDNGKTKSYWQRFKALSAWKKFAVLVAALVVVSIAACAVWATLSTLVVYGVPLAVGIAIASVVGLATLAVQYYFRGKSTYNFMANPTESLRKIREHYSNDPVGKWSLYLMIGGASFAFGVGAAVSVIAFSALSLGVGVLAAATMMTPVGWGIAIFAGAVAAFGMATSTSRAVSLHLPDKQDAPTEPLSRFQKFKVGLGTLLFTPFSLARGLSSFSIMMTAGRIISSVVTPIASVYVSAVSLLVGLTSAGATHQMSVKSAAKSVAEPVKNLNSTWKEMMKDLYDVKDTAELRDRVEDDRVSSPASVKGDGEDVSDSGMSSGNRSDSSSASDIIDVRVRDMGFSPLQQGHDLVNHRGGEEECYYRLVG